MTERLDGKAARARATAAIQKLIDYPASQTVALPAAAVSNLAVALAGSLVSTENLLAALVASLQRDPEKIAKRTETLEQSSAAAFVALADFAETVITANPAAGEVNDE